MQRAKSNPAMFTLMMLGLLCAGEAYIYERFYPGTEIVRESVGNNDREWKVDDPSYSPPTFTEPCDEDCDPESPETIVFDQKSKNATRRSWVDEYDVDKNNYPKNPKGRTGIAGRGSLSRWGPNQMVMLIITRGTAITEVLVKKTENTESKLTFIMGAAEDDRDCPFPRQIKEKFENELRRHYHKQQVKTIMSRGKQNSVLRYRGYYPDDLNTDNAWTELSIYRVKDKLSRHLGLMKFSDADSEYEWKQVQESDLKQMLRALIAISEMKMSEKVETIAHTTLWTVKNRKIGEWAVTLSTLAGNSLKMTGLVRAMMAFAG